MTAQTANNSVQTMTTDSAIVPVQPQQIAAADITATAVVEMFLAQHDAADSSIALYRRALRQFFTWVERTGRNTAYMTQADIIAYKKGLLSGEATADGQAKSPLTAASYLNAVKMFYAWLHDNNATIQNIAAGVGLPKRIKKFERQALTPKQAGDVLSETAETGSTRDNAIITLLLTAGLRTIEVIRADVKDMRRMGDNMVLYVQGKGQLSKNVPIPLHPAAYAAICKYLSAERPTATPDSPLFTCTGNRNKDGRLTTRSITRIARQHLDAVGLCHNFGERNSEYTAHSLRHTLACTMLAAGAPVADVTLMLRHASPATTQQYIYHVDTMRRIEATKKYDVMQLYKKTAK